MIDADFYSDWIEILRGRLVELGYTIPANSTHEDISILYFNALRRRIQPAHRSVHRSAEFSCPSELQAGFAALEAKIAGGDDLTSHLSRGLKRAGKQDDMLNDWGGVSFALGDQHSGRWICREDRASIVRPCDDL